MKKETQHIHLTGEPWGVYTLLLDGRDISHSVHSMTIDIQGSRPAEVTLRLIDGAIEADLQTDNINVEPNEGNPA